MPTENTGDAEFLRDVATHELKIIHDDGLYRHLRFKRPGTSCMHFDLITWPGHLCYTGDMGTYVFQRIEDMLEFFRRDCADQLPINPGYWSEKVLGVDGGRHAGCVFEYDHSKLLAVINEYLREWLEDLDENLQAELRAVVQDDLLDCLEDGDEHGNFRRVYEFSTEIGGTEYQFTDFWERSYRRFTHRYLWCCRALVWGIDRYDSATKPALTQCTYTTRPGESVMGIANRELRSSERWVEICDLNAKDFPDMGPHDYYPPGTVLVMPTIPAVQQGQQPCPR